MYVFMRFAMISNKIKGYGKIPSGLKSVTKCSNEIKGCRGDLRDNKLVWNGLSWFCTSIVRPGVSCLNVIRPEVVRPEVVRAETARPKAAHTKQLAQKPPVQK